MENPSASGKTPPPWLILLVITMALYLPGTGSIPLMDRDEPRFAHATMEMMQRDEWLIPYFNGEYRFDKPPLTYWWMRLHYHLLGFNELAARLHSVMAVWLVALVVFRTGARLFTRSAAWWASIGWLTCLQVLVHGRLCVADMPMVLCVTLTMSALMELLTVEESPKRPFSSIWWILWLSVGAGFLAKGPIALLVPGLALALWRLALWRKPVPWGRLGAGWGALVALLMVAAWGIPALWQTHGLFWKVGMGEHVVKRGTQAFNGRVVLPFYYFATAFLSLLPWIAFLPLVWRHLRSAWTARMALLSAWMLAPYLIFLGYATQLPHYVMPGFPAFFLLMGAALASQPEKSPIKLGWFGWTYYGLFLLLAVAVAGVAWGSGLISAEPLRWVLTAGALLLLGLVGLGIGAARGQRILMVASITVAALSLFPFGQALRSAHPVVQLAPVLKQLPAGRDLIAWRFTEPSLVFYSDRPWLMLSKLDKVRDRLARRNAGAILLLRREWTLSDRIKQLKEGRPVQASQDYSTEVEALISSSPGAAITQVSGYNLARSSWVELSLIVPQ